MTAAAQPVAEPAPDAAPAAARPARRRTRSRYQPDYAGQAERLCRLGATNADLAEAFGVVEKTVRNWMRRQKPFAEAARRGKRAADFDVADSLYRRARGLRQPEVKWLREGGKLVAKRTIRHVPPDTRACIFWLRNRRPDLWRDGATAAPVAPPPAPLDDVECARRLYFVLARGEAAAQARAAARAAADGAAMPDLPVPEAAGDEGDLARQFPALAALGPPTSGRARRQTEARDATPRPPGPADGAAAGPPAAPDILAPAAPSTGAPTGAPAPGAADAGRAEVGHTAPAARGAAAEDAARAGVGRAAPAARGAAAPVGRSMPPGFGQAKPVPWPQRPAPAAHDPGAPQGPGRPAAAAPDPTPRRDAYGLPYRGPTPSERLPEPWDREPDRDPMDRVFTRPPPGHWDR